MVTRGRETRGGCVYISVFPLINLMKVHPYVKAGNYVFSDTTSSGQATLSYEYVGGSEGEVRWIIDNPTSSNLYASILRGATLQGYQVPDYLFGDAYAEVYLANGLSSFVKNLNSIPVYSLALVDGQVAFVFLVPPGKRLVVPEYGFIGLQEMTYELVPLTVQGIGWFLVFYDPFEIINYDMQLGTLVKPYFDPYVTKTYTFYGGKIGYPVTTRKIFTIKKYS
ncbi:hypothetical protein SSRV2_ORF55 [Saccharolobus shibatae rod virus 2]|nr:hypothetical protein SSRV2_ORF55 [Saccharolobus shibatae rod virus 2]